MPASWEIIRARDRRILLSMIVPDDASVSMRFTKSLHHILNTLPPGSDFFQAVGLPYDAARNQALKAAVDHGYHLAFLDSDVLTEPDAFNKLYATGLQLVSGLYHQRYPPYRPAFFNEGRDDKGGVVRVEVTGWKPGDLVAATFVPTGLTLFRRPLLEDLLARFPLPFYWGVDIAMRPDFGGQQALPMCVPPGEDVLGGSPVESVREGEGVVGDDGRLGVVTQRWSKLFKGDLVRITPSVLKLPFTVTVEHKVLVVPSARCPNDLKTWCKPGHAHRKVSFQPIWIPAGALRPGMMLCAPILKGEHLMAIHVSYDDAHSRGVPNDHLPSPLPLTSEVLNFLGWYVAEGYVCKGEGGLKDVYLTLGPHELSQAKELARVASQAFNVRTSITRGHHAWVVRLRCPALAKTFAEWFGLDATLKHLPNWMLGLSKDQTAWFLRGLWAGDGHESYVTNRKRPILGFRTASKVLATQVGALLLKLGVRPEVRSYRQPRTSFSAGRGFIHHIVVTVDYPLLCSYLGIQPKPWKTVRDYSRSFFDGSYLLFPVKKVEQRAYEGPVYDLTVEPTHSFALGLATVSNSEDYTASFRVKHVLGIQPYVHTGIVGMHETRAVVGPRWTTPYPSNEPHHGVVGVP